MQMEPSPPDPYPHIVDKKVNNTLVMPSPLRWLSRSFSVRADPPSPFSSKPTASSFACMAPTATDSPPDTPKDVNKPKPAPAVMSAAAFVAFLSPRRLMQRAARAFRSSSRSRRRMKFVDARDEQPPLPVTSDGNNNGAAPGHQQQDHIEIEPVPAEKIIHEMPNHQPPVVKEAEACEKTTAADEKANSAADDEPKNAGVLVPVLEEEDVADKFCMVVKEAMMKKQHEEDTTGDDTKKEATRRFQGSLVKTAMPPRREVARSNDMIEEACTKLLAKRQGSRVRALVGAFETVMLDAKPAVTPGKPRRHYNISVV